MVDRVSILRRLAGEESEIAREAKSWLSSHDAELSTDAPANVTVSRTAHLWRVRLSNSRARGNRLHGAESLLVKLESLAQNKMLEQFAFHSAAKAGSIFFERTNGRFVGAVMMDQNMQPQREASATEAEHLVSARLS